MDYFKTVKLTGCPYIPRSKIEFILFMRFVRGQCGGYQSQPVGTGTVHYSRFTVFPGSRRYFSVGARYGTADRFFPDTAQAAFGFVFDLCQPAIPVLSGSQPNQRIPGNPFGQSSAIFHLVFSPLFYSRRSNHPEKIFRYSAWIQWGGLCIYGKARWGNW